MGNSVFEPNHQDQHLASKITAGMERLSEVLKHLLWNQAKATGVSPIQIQILIFIKHHDINLAQVSHLAQEFQVTKPTVSDAVKVLLQKGLIQKTPHPADGRAYLIQITSQGAQVVEQVEQFANPIATQIEGLTNQEQTQFFQILSKLLLGLHKEEMLSIQRMCYTCTHYRKTDQGHYCRLMETRLSENAIRIDCPEHLLPG